MTIDLENKMWVIEFPSDTIIPVEKQAEIRALFETEEVQTCPTRDMIKQIILFKTGVAYAVVLKYSILLKDKV